MYIALGGDPQLFNLETVYSIRTNITNQDKALSQIYHKDPFTILNSTSGTTRSIL